MTAQFRLLPHAGPTTSAMAGASTAAPVDFGSSYWIPAVLSGPEDQELLLTSALVFPRIHREHSLPAGAGGGPFPVSNRFGTVRSDSGVASGLATGSCRRRQLPGGPFDADPG